MKTCVFCGERPAVLTDAEGFSTCVECDALRGVPVEMLSFKDFDGLVVN